MNVSNPMLKKIRVALAIAFFLLTTLLFLDFTGVISDHFGWLAKIQFLPALLALNLVVVVALIALTLLFGRVYCSVICPLGVMQDIFTWFGKKAKKNRFSYKENHAKLRIGAFVVFVVLLVIPLTSFIAHLIAPYSAYGRIATNLFAPIYKLCNNGLASIAESNDSYLFYQVDLGITSPVSIAVALITLVGLGIVAWRFGRAWCNNICPVGTLLGYLSKISLFRPVINTDKCNGCGRCARNCKASCINPKEHVIDYSRCVTCFDCLENCKNGAIQYVRRNIKKEQKETESVDSSKRAFLTASALLVAGAAIDAKAKKVDGGLAALENKKAPVRNLSPKPAGSLSIKHFSAHCTACQLCISACPNHVLRPSTDLTHLMQPEMSYELGYCRPECNKCSTVCPAGAIQPITVEEKSSIQIGYAVFDKENCVVNTDNVSCGNCARHCPVGAIIMEDQADGKKYPAVNTEICIGCGACENLCPARPYSAIHVEGVERHREL